MTSGRGILLFTDEMVTDQLCIHLRKQGYDVTCCLHVGRSNKRKSDASQLEYAEGQARAIYTFNATDFEDIHERWQREGRTHMGIIVSEQIDDFPELLRRVKHHLDTVSMDEQYNCLLRLA